MVLIPVVLFDCYTIFFKNLNIQMFFIWFFSFLWNFNTGYLWQSDAVLKQGDFYKTSRFV